MPRLLVLTSVVAESDAVLGGREPAAGEVVGIPARRCATPAGLLDVVVGGVGAIAAALTAAAVLTAGYDVVLSAGVAGGFAPLQPGQLVAAEEVALADLGAELADGGFASLDELGLGRTRLRTDARLTAWLAARTSAVTGTVLTVATVTGTAERAARLRTAHPGAVAEAMEGAGIALAAGRAGVPFGELRAISNPVGPRDRQAWQLPRALAALSGAFDALLAQPLTLGGGT